eukprot:NODE_9754_length_627_cov_290.011905_g9486_i0.p1 GENE.NODE_9754_length_627_cov_290.011905_g9486_i0~~NODE_9754_length_627_cov_290.011905_g9486_i0.p1  ORF type:complete len:181 (+),score=45.83 NODE_9754_length_627_cov_290.011905_g9486_i0:57-545(+)
MPAPLKKTSRRKVRPVPGQVLICLAGRYRGRRVVCLKDLGKGVLLITGPFKVNGVPLRRLNRRYCICTSTKVDISSVKYTLPKNLFKRPRKTFKNSKKKTEGDFFKRQKWRRGNISKHRKQLQKDIDTQIIKILKSLDPLLTKYLGTLFSLRMHDKPHEMKF